jgi:S1-C subfamily serine protease
LPFALRLQSPGPIVWRSGVFAIDRAVRRFNDAPGCWTSGEVARGFRAGLRNRIPIVYLKRQACRFLIPRHVLPVKSLVLLMAFFTTVLHGGQWTNIDGKTIDADFVKVQGGALFIKSGGRTFSVPLDQMSPDSRGLANYLQEQMMQWAIENATLPILPEEYLLSILDLAPNAAEGRRYLVEGHVKTLNTGSSLNPNADHPDVMLDNGTRCTLDLSVYNGRARKLKAETNRVVLLKATKIGGKAGYSDFAPSEVLVEVGRPIVIRAMVEGGRIIGIGLPESSEVEAAQATAERTIAASAAEKEKRAAMEAEKSPPARPKPTEAFGSGFFITGDGYFITNQHVVDEAKDIHIVTPSGPLEAKVIKVDAANDLALVKVEGSFAALPVVSSLAVKLGSTVATVGFPNPDMQGVEPKLARGEIGSLTGIQDDPHCFQISAPIQHGNSGGPLVNARGNVIGVVVAKLNQMKALESTGAIPEGVNYAIKSSFLLGFLEGIPEVAGKLEESVPQDREFEDMVADVQKAVGLVHVQF